MLTTSPGLAPGKRLLQSLALANLQQGYGHSDRAVNQWSWQIVQGRKQPLPLKRDGVFNQCLPLSSKRNSVFNQCLSVFNQPGRVFKQRPQVFKQRLRDFKAYSRIFNQRPPGCNRRPMNWAQLSRAGVSISRGRERHAHTTLVTAEEHAH